MQVELSLAYDCEESVSREVLLHYIHHNRDQNARRINSIGRFSFPTCMVTFFARSVSYQITDIVETDDITPV